MIRKNSRVSGNKLSAGNPGATFLIDTDRLHPWGMCLLGVRRVILRPKTTFYRARYRGVGDGYFECRRRKSV